MSADQDLFSLENRVALVTGAAGRGYGKQIAEGLARAGAHVIVTSRELAKANKRAAELCARGWKASAAVLDQSREGSAIDCVKQIEADHGRLDILVNNAAANHLQSFEDVSLEDWNRVLHTNITGTLWVTRAVAPLMLEFGAGAIINLSSIYGLVSPDQRIYGDSGINSPLVYGVTKAAIIQMTRYWATYWAPKIRVNCITPGGLGDHQDKQFIANYIAKTPMGRMGQERDLEGAAVYLASDASKWMTGQNLIVDGGWTAW